MKTCIVRLPDDLVDALKQNRQLTDTSSAEFIRRAVRLALFADAESAKRSALWKSLSPEQRVNYPVALFGPEQYSPSVETR